MIQRLDELEDAKETPDEVAANFTCAMFESPQDVLKGARHMVSIQCRIFYSKASGISSICSFF